MLEWTAAARTLLIVSHATGLVIELDAHMKTM